MDHVVDKVRGTPCAYVIELEGDKVHPFYIYVGTTTDVQTRLAQHVGGIPGGAKWTALHPPNELLSLKVHETEEDAVAAECANWNLWSGRLKNYDRVRGGRLNGTEPLKYPLRKWNPETITE